VMVVDGIVGVWRKKGTCTRREEMQYRPEQTNKCTHANTHTRICTSPSRYCLCSWLAGSQCLRVSMGGSRGRPRYDYRVNSTFSSSVCSRLTPVVLERPPRRRRRRSCPSSATLLSPTRRYVLVSGRAILFLLSPFDDELQAALASARRAKVKTKNLPGGDRPTKLVLFNATHYFTDR
jgi:hypothetical protein